MVLSQCLKHFSCIIWPREAAGYSKLTSSVLVSTLKCWRLALIQVVHRSTTPAAGHPPSYLALARSRIVNAMPTCWRRTVPLHWPVYRVRSVHLLLSPAYHALQILKLMRQKAQKRMRYWPAVFCAPAEVFCHPRVIEYATIPDTVHRKYSSLSDIFVLCVLCFVYTF